MLHASQTEWLRVQTSDFSWYFVQAKPGEATSKPDESRTAANLRTSTVRKQRMINRRLQVRLTVVISLELGLQRIAKDFCAFFIFP